MRSAAQASSSDPRTSVARRFLVAALASSLVTAVVATRVQDDFVRVRHRVVRAPIGGQPNQPVTVVIPDVQGIAGAPAALVLEVDSRGSAGDALSIALDRHAIADIDVSPGPQRLDVSAWVDHGAHVLTITSRRAAWTLRSLELANIHGFSTWPVELVVVPRSREAASPPWWMILAILMVSITLGAQRWPRTSGRQRWLLYAAASLALAICIVVLAAPWLTEFAVLLSLRTLLLVLALLFAGQLATIATVLFRMVPSAVDHGRGPARASAQLAGRFFAAVKSQRWIAPHLLVTAVVLHGVGQFWTPSTGFTRLIAFGDQFAPQSVPALARIPHAIEVSSPGYDGQFYAQLALDPFLTDPATLAAMDTPAYRARRMFMPLMAAVGGLGHAPWVLQAYALMNVLCWLAFAALILHWAPAGSGRTTAVWIACVLSPGWDASIRRALTDGPSLLLVTCAALAVERGRLGTGGSALGLAALTRETSLVSGALLLPGRIRALRWPWLVAIAASLVPLGLWLLYLRRLGLRYDGGVNAVSLPFVALIDHGQVAIAELVSAASRPCGFAKLSTLIGLLVQAAYLTAHRHMERPWWRLGAAHALLMPILGSAVWDGCPGAVTRALLPLTVAFNLELLQTRRAFWVWWTLGNLGILAGSELIGIPAALALV